MRFLVPVLALISMPVFAAEPPPPPSPPQAVKTLPTDMVLCQRSVVTWAANYINGSEQKGVLENGIQLIQCSNAPPAVEPKVAAIPVPPQPPK